MVLEVFNRHEIKYLLSDGQFQKLLKILPTYMHPDIFNAGGKPYQICNLYLDTENDELISASLGKPVYKEKIRLRSYGTVQVQDNVFLEIKKKYKGLVNKRRTPILLSEAYDLFSKGKNPSSKEINPQVFSEISYLLSRYKVFPKVFISYDRFAFFENKNDDFRLTFDSKILTRRSDLQLESEIYGTPLLDDGMLLMEAKAEKTFPLWFAHFLAENKIYPVSFSKYGTEFIRNVQQNKI